MNINDNSVPMIFRINTIGGEAISHISLTHVPDCNNLIETYI